MGWNNNLYTWLYITFYFVIYQLFTSGLIDKGNPLGLRKNWRIEVFEKPQHQGKLMIWSYSHTSHTAHTAGTQFIFFSLKSVKKSVNTNTKLLSGLSISNFLQLPSARSNFWSWICMFLCLQYVPSCWSPFKFFFCNVCCSNIHLIYHFFVIYLDKKAQIVDSPNQINEIFIGPWLK